MEPNSNSSEFFRHISAENAAFYRSIMDVFGSAKRQYRLQLRPDEVLSEAKWPRPIPRVDEVSIALTQLTTAQMQRHQIAIAEEQ